MSQLESLLTEIRACRHCEKHLDLGPRPVLSAASGARILLAGQAPGTKVHESGIPWDDASGKRLRQWLDMDDETFYDASKVAIVPMGFCYPGKGKSGDLPPRPECAELWHKRLLSLLPDIKVTLTIGMYAQAYYLGKNKKKTLTATVENWREYGDVIPLPHPSPRNIRWFMKNRWFEEEVVPEMRRRVWEALG